VLDLFSGCGGLSLGFRDGSDAVNFCKGQPDEMIEQHARARDITKIDPEELVEDFGLGPPDRAVDVIVGGPPCQAYARVGRAKLREISEHPQALMERTSAFRLSRTISLRSSRWSVDSFYMSRTSFPCCRQRVDAFASTEASGERWWQAELHRIRGRLLIARGQHDESKSCFRRAIEVSREQGAKTLELRAATSLARLWSERGRNAEAGELLAPVHGWYTEGFDTPDLKEAKILLDALSS
jgi:hypothetical protein